MSEEIHEIKAMLRSAFERSPEFPTITAASLRGKRCGSRPVQRHFNRWRPRISPSRLLLRVANVDGRLLGLLPHERARYLALGALILADGMLTAGAIGLGISQAGIPTPLSILLIIGISLVCVLLTRYCSTSNRGSKWWLILP